MTTLPRIDNRTARRLFLERQQLSRPPHRKLDQNGLLDLIDALGFVQIDSISTVERAHHMILFARNQTYRRPHLYRLLERERMLFENWTHDAAIIPTRFYPYWRHRFQRCAPVLLDRLHRYRRRGFEQAFDIVREHVTANGPTMARHFAELETQKSKSKGQGWWDWHPSKTALEFLWRTGELAVARRQGFQKVYDLAERVIPEPHHDHRVDEAEFVDWACQNAMDRLGFATSGELKSFWDLITVDEAKAWCRDHLDRDIVEVEIEPADGSRPTKTFMRPETLDTLAEIAPPPERLRVISPFDPLIRDRKRLLRLFDFFYRIEVFVPEKKRQYGYYVFPLLERDRFVGRIDMRHDKDSGDLRVDGLWFEPGVRESKGRRRALAAELERIRRFVGAERVRMLV